MALHSLTSWTLEISTEHSCHRIYSIYIYTHPPICRSELLSFHWTSWLPRQWLANFGPYLIPRNLHSFAFWKYIHRDQRDSTRITGFGQIQPLRFFPATFSSEIGLQENFWSPVRSQRKASLVALNGIYMNPVFCFFFWSITYFPGFLPFCDLSPVESHCWLYQTEGASAFLKQDLKTKNLYKGVGLAWRCFQKLCPQYPETAWWVSKALVSILLACACVWNWSPKSLIDKLTSLIFGNQKILFLAFFWSYIHQSPRVYVTMLTSGRYNKIPTLFLVETLGTCQSSEKVIWLHIFWYFWSWCFNDNKSCWTFCSKFFKSRDSASSRSSVLREAHRRTRDHTISRWGLNMYTVMIHVIQDILVLSYLIFATQWVQG